MRNLNECQTEVFRRSEKRIKERKQRRKHILMACIPLVLCITLFSAFFLPEGADSGAPEAALGGLSQDRYESLTCPIAKITVSGLDFSKTYTNTSDVLLISDQLYSYGTRGPETNGTSSDGVADEGEGRKENADNFSGSIGYTITLVTHEGKKTEYYFAGNTLKNLTTNQTHTLSGKQVDQLKDLLGIPHK